MFSKTGAYVVNTVIENDECKDNKIWAISKEEGVKVYSYDEAVNITGHGPYNILLLIACCLALLGMILDMFAVAAVISVAACDLQLGTREEKIIMSTPFVGAILTAYFWGYISDTKGRRKVIMISIWGSFTASSLASLSTHWIMMTLMKIISVSCSACIQSACYTIIGECCGAKVRAVYYFILTSVVHLGNPVQIALHYYTLTLDFSIDLGVINFAPWRLLAIIFALPLAISAICFHFIYESPKFLANAGKEDEAVVILAEIWKKNRQPGIYPVKKLIANEERSSRSSEVPFLQSLWNQTAPLFKMPLLLKTLLLYSLIVIMYISCGALLSWFPFLADAFISGSLSNSTTSNHTEGLCSMIRHYDEMKNTNHSSVSCVPKSNPIVVGATAIQGLSLVIINCAVGFLANRRKLLVITTMLLPSLAALGCATLTNNVASLISFYAIFLTVISSGIVLSYFVDLYPTSYRGMASCLGLMAARFANIVGVSFGSFIMSHCNIAFYMISFLFLGGMILSCFLPSDQIKKSN